MGVTGGGRREEKPVSGLVDKGTAVDTKLLHAVHVPEHQRCIHHSQTSSVRSGSGLFPDFWRQRSDQRFEDLRLSSRCSNVQRRCVVKVPPEGILLSQLLVPDEVLDQLQSLPHR